MGRMSAISGLDANEARAAAEEFGVSLGQIERDHLISIILAALSGSHSDELVFFGGTALARTHLPHGRLSEDIDLICTGDRTAIADRIERTITRSLRATHGRPDWTPSLSSVRETLPAVLRVADGLTLRVQLLHQRGYPAWPTEHRDLYQRYSDVSPAKLRVLTLESFVASKTAAWHDRAAPRDLYDLWCLANIGAITKGAAQLFARYGPISSPPQGWMFRTPPSADRWQAQLAGQTRLEISSHDALAVVRDAWNTVVGD